MLRPVLVAVTLLAASLPAQADIPFTGRWAHDAASCRNTRAQGGERPMMITRWSIETSKTFCRVLAAVRTTSQTWRLRAHCLADGETSGEPRRPVSVTMRLGRDRMTMQKDAETRHLVRCPL